MGIQEFPGMLDDCTGSLSQAVQKREIERSRGTLHLDEQMALVDARRPRAAERMASPW